ncbi:hypothetical protein H4Q26_009668 [Puccinia striiformis f. sp. tritici PST-130]|nr:hypothetical protein H4Q26_009668 [Puccinia striiformis f. sp. tritici PST-130]
MLPDISGTQDSRQTPGQNPTQPRHESQTPNHTRVPSSQEMRGSLYTPATGAHYSSIDSGIISNHYSHLATPLTPQSGTRRSASSGAGFSPYPDVSAQVPLGANSYGQHHHAHRPDGPMLSGWPTSVTPSGIWLALTVDLVALLLDLSPVIILLRQHLSHIL